MGLDMYAYQLDARLAPAQDIDVVLHGDESTVNEEDIHEFKYWRKFNALHAWMEKLYRERGGERTFNVNPIRLYKDDILRLWDDAANNKLQPASGFFWGELEIYFEDLESLELFIDESLELLEQGRAVYYDSWW